jgi:hypothetical protein
MLASHLWLWQRASRRRQDAKDSPAPPWNNPWPGSAPYNCRYTRASIGLSAGQTPAWLASQLGHDLRTFFAKYADYIDGDNDAAELVKLEALEKHETGRKLGEIQAVKT